jgi:methylmalonyl-CoA mutase
VAVGALATGTISETSTAFDISEDLLTSFEGSPVRTVSVDLRPYHDAGASAVQELCYGLGALSEILAQLSRRGLSLSFISSNLQVLTSCSTSYFVEIAKLRALRLLVPQVINAYAEERGEQINFAPSDLFVQAETSRRTETRYDFHMNMLRGTTAAMAATIGGCDVLSVRPYDASMRPSDAFGHRIARNVQLILREEAHFDRVADPAAGAYYIEAATDQLAQHAWAQFQELENTGGMLEGLQNGHVQDDIQTVREERRQDVDDRKRVLVGTNHYPNLEETRLDSTDVSSPCNNGTNHRLHLKDASLDDLEASLKEGSPLSEVINGLQAPSSDIEPLPRIRVAEGIERLRLQTEQFATENDGPPVVFLAPLGPPGPRSARATFARNFFGIAGFEVREHLMFETPQEVADTAAKVTPDILVLCSADTEYPTLVPEMQKALNSAGLDPLLVVAAPPSTLDNSVSADEFIHSGAPLRDRLERIQHRLGVSENTSCEKG